MLSQKQSSPLLDQIRDRLIIKYRKLRQPNLLTVEGIKLQLGDYVSENVRKSLYIGQYERSELQIVKSWLTPDDIVMELGAGIGLISSYCAKNIGSDRVFTYEANPELECHIRNNYKLNGVNPTLEICLVGNQNGEKTFYLDEDFWASSINPRTANAQPIKVVMKSFSEELKRLKPTFLIIDIEGGEYELLKEGDLHNVKKISLELHEKFIGREKADFIKEKLMKAGFAVDKNLSNSGSKGLEELFFYR